MTEPIYNEEGHSNEEPAQPSEYPHHSYHLGCPIKNPDEEYCYNCHQFAENGHPYSLAGHGECRLNRPVCDGSSWRIVRDADWCPDFKKREGKRRYNYGR